MSKKKKVLKRIYKCESLEVLQANHDGTFVDPYSNALESAHAFLFDKVYEFGRKAEPFKFYDGYETQSVIFRGNFSTQLYGNKLYISSSEGEWGTVSPFYVCYHDCGLIVANDINDIQKEIDTCCGIKVKEKKPSKAEAFVAALEFKRIDNE